MYVQVEKISADPVSNFSTVLSQYPLSNYSR